jgi:SulP family sulfate permease
VYIIALLVVLVLFFGAAILTYTPKPLLGGLLMLLGLDFLDEWVVQGYRKLGRTDYAVVLLILGVIIFAGFLIGVGVGLVLMVVLFVVNYSRLNIFHSILSGAEVTSHVHRSIHHRRTLTKLATQVYILELEGFIFFGSANTILEQVRKRLGETDDAPLKFLVLDFRRVRQLDSSAAFSFTKVKFLADTHDFILLFSHLTEGDQRELARNGLEPSDRLRFFPDLDHALEWCEETLIARYEVTKVHVPATLILQLADYGFKKEYSRRLKDYLEKLVLEPGDYLIRQGEKTTELFFIEVGSVSVYLELNHEKRLRLETANMGTVVGELGYYLGEARAASVIATLKTIAYRLDREKHEQMKTADPELAIAFNELMVRVVAERLTTNTRELAALNR